MADQQMTLAEAKAAGLLDGKVRVKRTTRKSEPRAGARSRCVSHDSEWFTTDAAEDRHVAEHHGCRIEGEMI